MLRPLEDSGELDEASLFAGMKPRQKLPEKDKLRISEKLPELKVQNAPTAVCRSPNRAQRPLMRRLGGERTVSVGTDTKEVFVPTVRHNKFRMSHNY